VNDKIYLHEFIDIIGQGRAAYNHHMTANYGHLAREERRLYCVGVFSTVGSTERWPQSTNLWEYADGWEGVANHFQFEFGNSQHQDRNLVTWWAEAAKLRSGGYDRLLIPAHYSPTLQQLLDDEVRGECYYHEQVTLEPGGARRYLEIVEEHRLALAELFGWRLVGAYRTALVNDSEAILVWAVPTWHHWSRWEAAQESDPSVSIWRGHLHGIVRDWRNKLLVASDLSPVQTGEIL
jgi:hypothetical protein